MATTALRDLLDKLFPVKVIGLWKSTCGAILFQQAKFIGIFDTPQGVTLILQVRDPLWRQELQFQLPDLLEKFSNGLKQLGLESHQIPKHFQMVTQDRVNFRSVFAPRRGGPAKIWSQN